jgi:hypothetical protein
MSLSGSTATMPLPEVLGWAEQFGKTGVLHVSRGRDTVSLVFQGGAIRGCATDEPPMLLGQFLLSRGKIDETMLSEALAEQERGGESIGKILQRRGGLAPQEVAQYVNEKAEETILSLFAWNDAQFEFVVDGPTPANTVEIDIGIQELMLRGAQRQDEYDRIRSIFPDHGIVLRKTGQAPGGETADSPMARRLHDLVDGRRTLEQILLQSRASEMLALSLLYKLLRGGSIAVADVRETSPLRGTPEAISVLALSLLAKGDMEAALDTLTDGMTHDPRDEVLRRTLARVEGAYLREALDELPLASRPVAAEGRVPAEDALSANELFLLERVQEDRWDVRALVQIAPLHEIDVIRGLISLRRRGLIDVRSAPAGRAREPQFETADPFEQASRGG